jgi:hypothetical protein
MYCNRYLSFLDNPIEDDIPEFRCFIAHELPRLKYLDWLPITKEERAKGTKLDSERFWAKKTLPVIKNLLKDTAPNNAVTRHSVSYHKDNMVNFTKNIPSPVDQSPNVGSISGGSVRVNNFPTSTPSPVTQRNVSASPISEQFNGDFSALGTVFL